MGHSIENLSEYTLKYHKPWLEKSAPPPFPVKNNFNLPWR